MVNMGREADAVVMTVVVLVSPEDEAMSSSKIIQRGRDTVMCSLWHKTNTHTGKISTQIHKLGVGEARVCNKKREELDEECSW